MIIHFLDTDPLACARAHADPHVGVCLKEGVQILCDALHRRQVLAADLRLYKPYNLGGRFAVWAAAKPGHFAWLNALCRALEREHERRFEKPHASATMRLEAARLFAYVASGRWVGATEFPFSSSNVFQGGDMLDLPPLAGPARLAGAPACLDSHRAYYIGKLLAKPQLNVYATPGRPRPDWLPAPRGGDR